MNNFINKNTIGVALVALAAYLTYAAPKDSSGSAAPVAPATAFDKQVEDVFVGGNAADARYIGNVCLALAERLQADGTRPSPTVTNRPQIRSLLEVAGKLTVVGKTEGKYPKLPAVMVEGFKPFGIETGALTAADRTSAVACWTTIGNSCIRAAKLMDGGK